MMRVLAAALAASIALPLMAQTPAAQTFIFDCAGTVSTQDVFDGGASSSSERQWRIVASIDGGYVRRAPELAAGCLEPTVEICGCEPSAVSIVCRSLGLSSQGVEVVMDFSIDRSSGKMSLAGRRFDPRSGSVTETSGVLVCTESEARQ